MLAARIDSLPAPEKRALQLASVIGRTFWLEPLGRLGWEGDGRAAVDNLEGRGLVVARHSSSLPGQSEFAFKHALLRDVAYFSLPARVRARAHADVAAWIEESTRDRASEVAELIAYHYATAVDSEDADIAWMGREETREWLRGKAFQALIAAGISARRRYAITRAVQLHERALRLADGDRERATAHEAIADDHDVAYHGDAAVESWDQALALLRRDSEQGARRAAICLKAARMAVLRWGGFPVSADPSLGDRAIDEGLSVAGDAATRAQFLALRALCGARWAWYGRRDPRPPRERREAADFMEGHYDDGVQAALAHLELIEPNDVRELALGHMIASVLVGDVRGRYEESLGHALISHRLSRGLSAHEIMHATCEAMSRLTHLGRWREVDPFLAEHLDALQDREREMSCPYIRCGPLFGALALAHRRDVARARQAAAEVPPSLDHPGQAEAIHAQLCIELGEVSTARALLAPLLAMGRGPGPEEIPRSRWSWWSCSGPRRAGPSWPPTCPSLAARAATWRRWPRPATAPRR